MKESPFFNEAKLMLQTLPNVMEHDFFALKGGTAINLFLRDMPRLSVDIDLTYLPIEDRDTSLKRIHDALEFSAEKLKRVLRLKVNPVKNKATGYVNKLLVSNAEAQIKVETNEILRGSVFPCEERDLSKSAQKIFELSATVKCLSEPDLYGGKICAALDRQHPRDFFDIKLLLDKGGVTEKIKTAFIIYLAGHNRPISELLHPKLQDIEAIYREQFEGMTIQKIQLQDLYHARDQLLTALKKSLTDKDKKFLLSIKEGIPDWDLLKIEGLNRLPSINWKLSNIKKMSPQKHQEALDKLKSILSQY